MPEHKHIIAPLCGECELHPLCHKYGDSLWHVTCGDIYNTMYYWALENQSSITEDIFCFLLRINREQNALHSIICEKCGKEFFSRNPDRRFCSILCKLDYAKKVRRDNMVCQYCGEMLQTMETCFCSDCCRDEMLRALLVGKATLKNPSQPTLFSCWLMDMLEEAGVSQNILAQKLKLSPSAITKWLQGTAFPDRGYIPLLATMFNYDIYQLECMILDDYIVRNVKNAKIGDKVNA